MDELGAFVAGAERDRQACAARRRDGEGAGKEVEAAQGACEGRRALFDRPEACAGGRHSGCSPW